jgi:outer membrane lipoprotein-sorting protein
MTERNEHQPVDDLDLATAALRDMSIPDGPPPQLAASTVEALQSANIPPDFVRLHERKKKMFRLMRYSGAAAAVALLAVLAGWLFLMDRTASPAFANVVEKIKNAKSVTFVTKMPTVIQGTKKGILQQKMYIQGDAYRMEIPSAQEGVQIPPDAPPIVVVLLADWKQKKAILLDYTTKTAKKMESDEKTWREMAKAMADPIKQLRQLKEQDAERIGEEELNGRKTHLYRLKRTDIFMGLTITKDETAKLWVDPKSGLPVRIAVGDPTDLDKPFVVFEQFAWNEALDPELFKLDVPKGFTLKDK